MSRSYSLYLKDMLKAIDHILLYTATLTEAEFARDDMRVEAVLFNFVIIGEAAKNLPDAIQAQSPTTDWRGVTGLRDRLTHEYFRTDLSIVWDIVQNNLPALRQEVDTLLQVQDQSENSK